MSELYQVVQAEVEKVIAEIKLATADKKLTLSEVWSLAQVGIASFINIADSLSVSGEDKKVVVMKAAEKLYDDVIAPIDISKIPNVLEPAFDRFAKTLYLELISGAVDFIVKFKKG